MSHTVCQAEAAKLQNDLDACTAERDKLIAERASLSADHARVQEVTFGFVAWGGLPCIIVPERPNPGPDQRAGGPTIGVASRAGRDDRASKDGHQGQSRR